jgi:hypothetical protein
MHQPMNGAVRTSTLGYTSEVACFGHGVGAFCRCTVPTFLLLLLLLLLQFSELAAAGGQVLGSSQCPFTSPSHTQFDCHSCRWLLLLQ